MVARIGYMVYCKGIEPEKFLQSPTRVVHVTHGEGVIIGIEKKRDDIHVAEVKFDSGTKSKLHLEVVIKMGLLHLA